MIFRGQSIKSIDNITKVRYNIDDVGCFCNTLASNEQIEIKYLIHLPSEHTDANAADYYFDYLFPETLARDLLETA